jgi:hypothetical protein
MVLQWCYTSGVTVVLQWRDYLPPFVTGLHVNTYTVRTVLL